jgi:hypothetical protein
MELHQLDYGAGPLSEGAAFGLAGGLGFLYLEMPGMKPPIYLVGRTADLERDVSEHLGIGLDVRETEDPEEGWRWVRDEIDAGRPPMVWADIGHLEYLRVRMHNTRHDIVIVGYDENEGIAWVADNDRDELQACSLDSLATARSSDGFPGPNLHTTFFYEWPESLRKPAEATRLAIERAVANMRDGGDAIVISRRLREESNDSQPPTRRGLRPRRGLPAVLEGLPHCQGNRWCHVPHFTLSS